MAVDRKNHTLRIAFNPHTEAPAPFAARLEFAGLGRRETFQEVREDFRADRTGLFRIPESLHSQRFRVRLTLDDCLAYSSEIDPTAPDILIRPI